MLDHDAASLALISRVFAGAQEGLTKDDIIDNVSMYWLTKTAVSSARLYWDNAQTSRAGFFDPKGVQIAVAVSYFPDEIYAAPETWARQAYPNLISWRRHPVGGHFAGWEQPLAVAEDLREAFRRFCQTQWCSRRLVARKSPAWARQGDPHDGNQ
jgi:hypothetical protein